MYFSIESYVDEMQKLAAAKWKSMLLSGKVRREASRLKPLISKAKDRFLPGLEKGNKSIMRELRARHGTQIWPNAPSWFSSPTMQTIAIPKVVGKSKAERAMRHLSLRHELDELRVANRMMTRAGKGNPEKILAAAENIRPLHKFRGDKAKIIGQHASPEILRRESALTTFAPKEVRRNFERIRRVSGEKSLLRRSGMSYGRAIPMTPSGAKTLARKIQQKQQQGLLRV